MAKEIQDIIDALIEKLPDHLKSAIELYAPFLLGWSEHEAIKWLNDFMGEDYDLALKRLYTAMTSDERDKEQQRQIDVLRALNHDNAAAIKLQREALMRIFLALLGKL